MDARIPLVLPPTRKSRFNWITSARPKRDKLWTGIFTLGQHKAGFARFARSISVGIYFATAGMWNPPIRSHTSKFFFFYFFVSKRGKEYIFLGAFVYSRKAPISVVMSVRLYACNSVASTGRIFVKFDIGKNTWKFGYTLYEQLRTFHYCRQY